MACLEGLHCFQSLSSLFSSIWSPFLFTSNPFWSGQGISMNEGRRGNLNRLDVEVS
jgi:hypothetical protein